MEKKLVVWLFGAADPAPLFILRKLAVIASLTIVHLQWPQNLPILVTHYGFVFPLENFHLYPEET